MEEARCGRQLISAHHKVVAPQPCIGQQLEVVVILYAAHAIAMPLCSLIGKTVLSMTECDLGYASAALRNVVCITGLKLQP